MGKNKHLSPDEVQSHKTNPENPGCLIKHQGTGDYHTKKWAACSYRKHAHDYAKVNEEHIYNIPNMRSPERWVRAIVEDGVRAPMSKDRPETKGKPAKKGRQIRPAALPIFAADGKATAAWHLPNPNFEQDHVPYWHNSHHIIAAGELSEVFTEDYYRKVLVASSYNIHKGENCMILPKQRIVASALRVPVHVPEGSKAEHDSYSKRLETHLGQIKTQIAKTKVDEQAHPDVPKAIDGLADKIHKVSLTLRDVIFASGLKNPGLDIDGLEIDLVEIKFEP